MQAQEKSKFFCTCSKYKIYFYNLIYTFLSGALSNHIIHKVNYTLFILFFRHISPTYFDYVFHSESSKNSSIKSTSLFISISSCRTDIPITCLISITTPCTLSYVFSFDFQLLVFHPLINSTF